MADKTTIEQIIAKGDPDVLIREAEALGKQLAAADLKNNQLRNIYTTVKQVEVAGSYTDMQGSRRVKLLIPRLQYLSAREPRLAPLSSVLTECIRALPDFQSEKATEQFRHFAEFFEAVVAYHYAFGKSRRA